MKQLIIAVLGVILLAGCYEDEHAFDVIESPVLATFDQVDDPSGEMMVVEATFYELDKSGILDKDIGIDSIALSNLVLQVFVNQDTEIAELTTDSEGVATFEYNMDDLNGVSRLEWVGSHKETPFRVFFNF